MRSNITASLYRCTHRLWRHLVWLDFSVVFETNDQKKKKIHKQTVRVRHHDMRPRPHLGCPAQLFLLPPVFLRPLSPSCLWCRCQMRLPHLSQLPPPAPCQPRACLPAPSSSSSSCLSFCRSSQSSRSSSSAVLGHFCRRVPLWLWDLESLQTWHGRPCTPSQRLAVSLCLTPCCRVLGRPGAVVLLPAVVDLCLQGVLSFYLSMSELYKTLSWL